MHGPRQGRAERLICWDCGARFERGAGATPGERESTREIRRPPEPTPTELLSSRVRLALLIVALTGLALLAVLGLYELGFFDWVQCSVDSTAEC